MNSLFGCRSNRSNTVIIWLIFIFMTIFYKISLESPLNYQAKMIHDNNNNVQCDSRDR